MNRKIIGYGRALIIKIINNIERRNHLRLLMFKSIPNDDPRHWNPDWYKDDKNN
ncbi:hypothetical protein C2G38_2183108 [Gigaspora rosea]|uniref:Uncharacterized protein n=1 Tax=Gigaspora rosea TaxID=44941 RepID=A0A397VB83_9GLOM|nr:hypothetical protein C2G38_2183108 [Gigaspora rosea]